MFCAIFFLQYISRIYLHLYLFILLIYLSIREKKIYLYQGAPDSWPAEHIPEANQVPGHLADQQQRPASQTAARKLYNIHDIHTWTENGCWVLFSWFHGWVVGLAPRKFYIFEYCNWFYRLVGGLTYCWFAFLLVACIFAWRVG